MRNTLLNFWLVAMLALTSHAVSAQDAETASTPGYSAVQSGLANGDTPEAIITTLLGEPHNMTLAEATVFALVAGGEANRVAFATAGVGLATNLAQAQGVASAVKAAAGETGAVASAVDVAMDDYVASMPQPNVYENKYSPTGGGDDVSPSN